VVGSKDKMTKKNRGKQNSKKSDIQNDKQNDKQNNNKYRIILIVIFVIAILVRIYNDPTIPYHYDPGKNIVYSRAVLDWFPFFPQYNQYFNLGEYYEYQVLFPYIVTLLYKITGFSLVDITSWSIIIIGSLMVITVYLLSKEIFNSEIAALISAGLIALSKIQLFSYMNYYPQILGLMLLPIPFIFIIRYTKTLDKKYLIYTSILSVLVILSSYLVGTVYVSILILSLIIYSIVKKDLKYIYGLISIIIGTIALITFYTLPIIDRYGIKSFIIGIINTIVTTKDIPFTNLSLFQSDVGILNVFSFLVIIALILCTSLIIYLYNRKSTSTSKTNSKSIDFSKIKYEHILLALWISISLILIESYKFRPVLWVDRYIEFLDISGTILVGYAIYFILNKIKSNQYLTSSYKLISALILICIFSYPTYDVIVHNYRFGYWNTPNDLETLNWVENNISSESLFVAPGGITSFWISALGGVHVLGGESSQILGDKFDGNSYSNTIINSPNVDEKMDLIRKFGVQYIYITTRSNVYLLWNNDYNIEGIKAFDNPKYFEIIYMKQGSFSSTYIIKVKEDLTPKYSVSKINEGITIFGYAISLTGLVIMIFVTKSYRKVRRKQLSYLKL
jgi:hypothetical protein